jgi:hypothetical protein
VCTHIAHAIDTGTAVGFFWGDETDTARPDAWCRACKAALLAVPAGTDTSAVSGVRLQDLLRFVLGRSQAADDALDSLST